MTWLAYNPRLPEDFIKELRIAVAEVITLTSTQDYSPR